MNNSKGFTIIELVTVIAIIGILSSVILVRVQERVIAARIAAVKGDLHQLAIASTQYVDSNGSYSSFCGSSDDEKVAGSIEGINPNYKFSCLDSGSSYSTPSSSMHLLLTPTVFHTLLLGSTGGPCSENQWYAHASGLKTSSGCWCVDSAGSSIDSCGNSDTCSCE